jgi:hypothetical protein
VEFEDLIDQVHWTELVYDDVAVRLVCEVSTEPVRRDGIILAWTAYDQQRFADRLGASLLTARLADIMHVKAAVKVLPVLQVPPGSGHITAAATSEEFTKYCDARISLARDLAASHGVDLGAFPFVSGLCKDWVLDMKIGTGQWGMSTAVNHGWYDPTAPYQSPVSPWFLRLWQAVGARHNNQHRDPSQGGRFVKLGCRLEMAYKQVITLTFPELLQSRWAWIVSHTGKLRYVRQPNVPTWVPKA